jgi:hypothetical protein
MRMRKLGKGQSVVLCSSMEVQRKILEHSNKSGSSIEVADVLAWCITETCAHTRRSIPLWATQGRRHQYRQAMYSEPVITPALVEALLEPEAQSLQQRYEDESIQHAEHSLISQSLMTRQTQLNDIEAKCHEFELESFSTVTLQEEQERELSPENEREQQVELPPSLEPCSHSIHKDLWDVVNHGVFNRSSDAFQPAFKTLRNTTAVASFEATAWPHDLLVTTDFAKTVRVADGQLLDSFLRPVNWIMSYIRGNGARYVILSPYEAQELLPFIRQHKQVSLHIYSPRLSLSVRTLEDLSLCAIPAVPDSWSTPIITKQLNLFAGQLYFRALEDCVSQLDFLGLCSSAPDDDTEVARDGFITPANRAKLSPEIIACPFTMSPVPFVRAIISFRRKGQSITASHMGKILNGELIAKEDFEGL